MQLVPPSDARIGRATSDGSEYDDSIESSAASAASLVTLYVFENERRQIVPPWNWSSTMLAGERERFSDEAGGISTLTANILRLDEPPSGHEWVLDGRWIVDIGVHPIFVYACMHV